MKRCAILIDDIRDATSLMQVAECLDEGQPVVLAFDGVRVVVLPGSMARDGFIRGVFVECITPGQGLP